MRDGGQCLVGSGQREAEVMELFAVGRRLMVGDGAVASG